MNLLDGPCARNWETSVNKMDKIQGVVGRCGTGEGDSGRERTYGEANQSTGQVPTMLSTMRVINRVMRSNV